MKYTINDTTLTGIADAIRKKTGYTAPMTPAQMIERIRALKIVIGGKYEVADYIQSSGLEHINTGFVANQNTRIVCSFELTAGSSVCAIFGARKGLNVDAFAMWAVPSSNLIGPQYGPIAYDSNKITLSPVQRLTYDMNKNVATVGNKTVTAKTATFDTTYPVQLFTLHNAEKIDTRKAIGRMYWCEIYDNGKLVRDFIPVDHPNGAGMYDMIGGKFYGNEGDGSFVAGWIE